MPKKQNFIRRYFTFSGRMSMPEFWSEIGTGVIGAVCGVVILTILVCVVIPGDVSQVRPYANGAICLYGVVLLIRLMALMRRRLRDGGFSAGSFLWLLLPVAGWILLILRLCSRSVAKTDSESEKKFGGK